jgi:hypothetical protein
MLNQNRCPSSGIEHVRLRWMRGTWQEEGAYTRRKEEQHCSKAKAPYRENSKER